MNKTLKNKFKRLNKTHRATIKRLEELFQEEHGQCDSNTCDMSVCFSAGYTLWAIYLWSGGGAAGEECERLYSKLPTYFYECARYECDQFLESTPSIECKCGSYIYNPEECDGYCSTCGRENDYEVALTSLGQAVAKAI